ncbi:MAG TPA: gamma-glutamyl-gamma-aminobutyrate hydrolase family protein [Candidatus Limnocylindrales bacterium]|nr:gamma-glutamyl-gamma-aminobutyrate hydrolase family protein [Candidatus Limnocylindrales bacterium]
MSRPPRIVITVQAPSRAADPALSERRNALYAEAVRRHGGEPLTLDEGATEAQRQAAFASMDGLLFSGGADVDPARFGEEMAGTQDVEAERDELEWQAWQSAEQRSLPVLGICRGLQAINVFAGGRLIQHLDGHQGQPFGHGEPLRHPLILDPTSRLAAILGGPGGPGGPGSELGPEVGPELEVNSYHHQGVSPEGLAPTLRAAGLSPWEGPGGHLVEALESADPGRFTVAVQSHPERRASTPERFERLFEAFIEAARGP